MCVVNDIIPSSLCVPCVLPKGSCYRVMNYVVKLSTVNCSVHLANLKLIYFCTSLELRFRCLSTAFKFNMTKNMVSVITMPEKDVRRL